MLEDVQSDKATISRALTQNRTLKDQLAELQNGFVQLTNENMELTSAIQSEQHVKKELARRMGELQEQLHNVKEQVRSLTSEAQGLVEQRDQVAAHLQQYSAAYQALASEREQLHRQYFTQSQLMDRLQHDESQGRAQLEVSQNELKRAQEHLDHLVQDNEHLKAEVRELLNSSALAMAPRDEGDGVESKLPQETIPESSAIIVPQDFESQKEMVRTLFHNHQTFDPYSIAHPQVITRFIIKLSRVKMCPEGEGVPVEVHQALQMAMEKLQERFTSLMQEKADLKEPRPLRSPRRTARRSRSCSCCRRSRTRRGYRGRPHSWARTPASPSSTVPTSRMR
uniref:Golgin subfamily A conserved domain-containing protein n=1 Tax=Hippocampus comes TaxID=109280 RepID=A0A3Q3D3W2_HIPCM